MKLVANTGVEPAHKCSCTRIYLNRLIFKIDNFLYYIKRTIKDNAMNGTNDTHNEHYIPQFFIKQFYAKEDCSEKNAKSGMICCYDLTKHKQHPAHSDDVFFQEDLYETAASNAIFKKMLLNHNNDVESVTNYFEKKFGSIEKEASKHFKKMLLKCDNGTDRCTILSCNQIEYFIHYIIIQFLRIPQLLELQIDVLYETFCQENRKNGPHPIITMSFKHSILKYLTEHTAGVIDFIYKTILFNHDMCILKLPDDFSFFSSNIPIFFFDYDGDGNIFQKSNILFPISPKYCIAFLTCEYKKHSDVIHKKLIFGNKDVYIEFVYKFFESATKFHEKIFSDSLSKELIHDIELLDLENNHAD